MCMYGYMDILRTEPRVGRPSRSTHRRILSVLLLLFTFAEELILVRARVPMSLCKRIIGNQRRWLLRKPTAPRGWPLQDIRLLRGCCA